MSYFEGAYLRVLTPKTSNGTNVIIKNDRIQYREDHLPLSAKKGLEQENLKLPDQLKHKIEVVGGWEETPQIQIPVIPVLQADTKKDEEIERLRAELKAAKAKPAVKAATKKPAKKQEKNLVHETL